GLVRFAGGKRRKVDRKPRLLQALEHDAAVEAADLLVGDDQKARSQPHGAAAPAGLVQEAGTDLDGVAAVAQVNPDGVGPDVGGHGTPPKARGPPRPPAGWHPPSRGPSGKSEAGIDKAHAPCRMRLLPRAAAGRHRLGSAPKAFQRAHPSTRPARTEGELLARCG